MAPIAPPERAPVAAGWFSWYLRRLARRTFAGVHWGAAEDPARWDETPIVAVANHSTWWDGPLALLLTAQLQRTFYVAMDAAQLTRYPYFSWIGARPLRRTTPRARFADLERLGEVLQPGSMLWIFPQGERRPARAPMTGLERGAAHLALTAAPVRVVPVAIRLSFLSEQRPEAFVRLGPSQVVGPREIRDRKVLTEEFGTWIRWTLEETDARIAEEQREGWQTLVAGAESVNLQLDRIGHRVGWRRGPLLDRNG
jgi:1-acyl-sn-glycerol-3-phosphate acyltransferase